MTHNENRTYWIKEGLIGLGVGVLYGVSNVSVGHPFDTIKTKMQAQTGFERGGMFSSFIKVLRSQGIVGVYRGCVPILWGSGIYRSTQFGVFEGVYTYLDTPFGHSLIPGTAGVQPRVVIGGMVASTARAIIETPLEYVKIRGQTNQMWTFRNVYTGFKATWCRTMGLMTTYFILIDSERRHFPKLFTTPIIGPFLASGVAATIGWWVIWPLEVVKSQVQGDYGKNVSIWSRLRHAANTGGIRNLYRGFIPGTIRSFIANGTAMVVMIWAQKKVTELGLRG